MREIAQSASVAATPQAASRKRRCTLAHQRETRYSSTTTTAALPNTPSPNREVPTMQRCLLGLFALVMTTSLTVAADWPQFRGPNRDGLSKETGLLATWDKGGPEKVWTAKNLGIGFGTVSVADGKIYGLGTRDGKEGVWCVKESDGSELWFQPILIRLEHLYPVPSHSRLGGNFWARSVRRPPP